VKGREGGEKFRGDGMRTKEGLVKGACFYGILCSHEEEQNVIIRW
jgi:hypothetical protein